MTPHWALSYSTNSHNPRAKKWYRVVRVIFIDGKWWELYWHENTDLRGGNRDALHVKATEQGLEPLPGLFFNPPYPHSANEVNWSLAGSKFWAKEFQT